MDEEQAHRMAAAEALCLISTRVDKSGLMQKLSGRGRKKKTAEYALADTTTKNGIKDYVDNNGLMINNGSSERRVSYEGRGGSNNGTVKRGRGSRGRGSSPRGRGGGKSSNRGHNKSDDIPRSNIAHKKLGQEDANRQRTKSSSKDSASRRTQRTKSGTNIDNSELSATTASDKLLVQAIGFTGATITCMSEPTSKRRNSNSVEASQSLASQGFKQMSLPAGKLPSTTPTYNLPSINLASFTPEVNLPSLPLEIGSLQLSSQPTPNLSSWGDMAEGLMGDDCSSANRKKMEKFLPLKKRKHHSSSEADIKEAALPPETVLSDSEGELSESSSPPPLAAEPLRASFTVQAPPIITMQTLMEIKTALTPDDDGDLPLHIAVVHENMRMVIKLINLMRIAGKGVDKFNKQQQTPLHLAVKLNFMEAIDILLKSNANVNAVDCTGSSCVHMAVQGKSNQCLTMLLERCANADLNMRNFDGLTPLHIAVDNGDLQQVETLLKYNADIDVTDGKSGRSALFRAAESNQKTMVEVLLNRGANPDIPNYAGVTTAMAAQGRNLHGVLKLLGAVASEKVADIDVKPGGLSLEVKPAVTYLCYPSGDAVPLSHPSTTKGLNSVKQNLPAVTCVMAPKVNAEKVAELVSVDETKVFQNVFVMLPDRKSGTRFSHSKSEPSSPEVKMEVVEAKEGETTAAGLLSLPEGLLSSSEVDMDRQPTAQPKRVTQGDAARSMKRFETKPEISVSNPHIFKSTGHYLMGSSQNLVRMELTSSPSFAKTSSILAGTVVSPPVIVSSTTADLLRSVKPTWGEAGGVTSSVGSVNLPSLPPSDTSVTLTSHQARLFQMLLKMYNIDPSNQPAASSANKPLTPSSPKVTLSASLLPYSSLSSATVASNSNSNRKNPTSGILSHLYPNQQKRAAAAGFASCESTNGEGSSYVEPASFSQQKLLKVHGNSFNYIRDSRRVIGSQPIRPEESPLNLTTASRRTTLKDTVCDDSCKKHSNLMAADSTSDTSGVSRIQSEARAEQSPAQKMKQAELMPPRVSRVADEVSLEEDLDDAHVEVYVKCPLPSGKATFPVRSVPASTVEVFASSPFSEFNKMCLSQGLSPGSVESKLTALHQQPDFSSKTSGVSKKTASIVKDYLSNQNQFLRSQPLSPSMPSLLSIPISSRRFSGPSVLDLPKEPDNPLQQKLHMISESKNVPSVTGGTDTSDDVNTSATTSVLPAVSSSPVYLDQGHAIDLSVGRAPETNRNLPSALSSPSSSSPQSELTRVIGFSGAILSVPPKLERPDKRGPREVAPKESKKKRGRKSQKEAQAVGGMTDISKINSETDQKLKQFLGAKKVENVTLLHNPNLIFCADSDQSSGMETHEGDADEDAGCDAQTSNLDTTFTTVGIFSGSLQRVKVSKKASVPTSPVDSPKVSLSFNSLGSLDSTLLDRNFHGRPALSVEGEGEQIKIFTVTEVSSYLTSAAQSNSLLSTLGMSVSDRELTNSCPGRSENSYVQDATLCPGTNSTGVTVLSDTPEACESEKTLFHKEGHRLHLVCSDPDSGSAAGGLPIKGLSTPPKKRRRRISASEDLLQTLKSAVEVTDELIKSPILSNETGQRNSQKKGHKSCSTGKDIQVVESAPNSKRDVQAVESIHSNQKDVQVIGSISGSQQDVNFVESVGGKHKQKSVTGGLSPVLTEHVLSLKATSVISSKARPKSTLGSDSPVRGRSLQLESKVDL